MRLFYRKLVYRISGMSIRSRLILYLLIGLILTLLVSFYFSVQAYRVRINQVLLNDMATAQAISNSVSEFADGIAMDHAIIILTIIREKMNYQQITSYLTDIHGTIPTLETINFADSNGVIRASSRPGSISLDISDRKYFKEIASGKIWTVSSLLNARGLNKPAVTLAHRVEINGIFAGALISVISPDSLQEIVTSRAAPVIGYGILDSNGVIIVTTNSDISVKNPDRSWIPSVKKALKGEPTFAEPFIDKADGLRKIGAAVPVPGIGWVVNVFEPVSTATATARRQSLMNNLIILLIGVIMIISIWIIGTRLSYPIKDLAHKADAVAHGDFNQRIETYDRAELGMLAAAFNNMTIELANFRDAQMKANRSSLFLADVGEILTSTLDRNVAIQSVTSKATECIGDIVTVLRKQPNGNLKPVAIYTENPDMLAKIKKMLSKQPPDTSLGIVGSAIRENHTIFIPRISDVTDPDQLYYLRELPIQSIAVVPMRVYGQVVGALSVSNIEKPMEDNNVILAEEVARRIGIALENISLYEDSLEREKFLRGLVRLAGDISTTLDPEMVLNAICNQTMNLLNADGVYIWIIDDSRLIGGASCGYKAALFKGMSIPVIDENSGAGRALIERKGFIVHQMQSKKDIISEMNIKFHTQSAIFQPLISAGEALGVMVIIDANDPNHFVERDLTRSGLLSGYASTALSNARAYARERRIAETLQRGLLSDVPESIDGFEIAYYYTPARSEAAIGGDFYDFIELDDKIYGLLVGDVSGKGLNAAVITAMAKYVVRAYVADDPDPEIVLSRANNAIYKYTVSDMFVTMMYGILDTENRKFCYSSAGHEPLMIYRAKDGSVEFKSPSGLVSGLKPDNDYESLEFIIDPGDILMMYTDGLTDARSPQGGFLGSNELANIVKEFVGMPAGKFLSSLMDRVSEYTGGEFADDVAVLVLRAQPVNIDIKGKQL